MKFPKLNYRMKEKVKEKILNDPKNFNMSMFARHSLPRERTEACKTTACIAGWAVLSSSAKTQVPSKLRKWLTTGKLDQYNRTELNYSFSDERDEPDEIAHVNWSTLGAEALGITGGESDSLFLHDDWLFNYGDKYEAAKSPQTRAKVAAEYLDLFFAAVEMARASVSKDAEWQDAEWEVLDALTYLSLSDVKKHLRQVTA